MARPPRRGKWSSVLGSGRGSTIVPAKWLLPPNRRVVLGASQRRASQRVICSLALGEHRRLLAIGAATFAAYSSTWGWDLVISSEDLAPDRPPAWAKIPLILELLGKYETVLWLDADTTVVDVDRNILMELPEGKDLYLVEHVQPGAPGTGVPNSGVMLVRRSDWSIDFLRRLWNCTEFIHHNWWENAAVLALLGYPLAPPYRPVVPTTDLERVGFIDLAWNSVPASPSSTSCAVIHHHARADHDDFDRRLASMASDLQRLLETRPDLIPVNLWRQILASTRRGLARFAAMSNRTGR